MWNSKATVLPDCNPSTMELKDAVKEKEWDEFKFSGKILKGARKDTDKEMNSMEVMGREVNIVE